MNFFKVLVAAGVATLGLSLPAIAQSTTAPASPPPRKVMSEPAVPVLAPSQRAAITRDLIARWRPAVDKRPEGGGARWARILAAAVNAAQPENVLRATTATSVDEVHDMLNGHVPNAPASVSNAIGNGAVAPQTLGSTTNDLVYTPLPNGRCRVADSRVIAAPLGAGVTRALLLEEMASYTAQGGDGTYANGNGSTNCGMPILASAYALSVTLLSPAGNGVFKVMPFNAPPQIGNSILFNAGDFGANGDLIVKNCRGCSNDISINSSGASVHYVIDVIGYFMPPQRTFLSCYNGTEAAGVIPVNGEGWAYAPGCAMGYTAVTTFCRLTNYGTRVAYGISGICQALNTGTFAVELYASVRCCQIPGR
jgi:hypothetical protein